MPSTLRSSRDIRAVFATRHPVHGRALSLHARRRDDGLPARSTVVAGKQVGGAVQRNRAKRRLRALLEEAGRSGARFPDGLDLVLVVKEPAVHLNYGELSEDLAQAWRRLLARMERER